MYKKMVLALMLGCGLSMPGLVLATDAPKDSKAVAAAPAKPAVAVKSTTTLENLTSAFNRESQAQVRYLAYAKKAETEGYLKVAKLFKAVAMSEGIHAVGHAKAIEASGAKKPKASEETPVIGTTQENLASALKGEKEEVETIYPGFAKIAEQDKNVKAQRSFQGAMAIESIHIKLLSAAAANLDSWKKSADFYVCKVCGNVVEKLDFEYCSICKAPLSEFVKI